MHTEMSPPSAPRGPRKSAGITALRVRCLRDRAGWTQVEAAEQVGIQAASYARIEQGRVACTRRNWRLLCTRAGVPESWAPDAALEDKVRAETRSGMGDPSDA